MWLWYPGIILFQLYYNVANGVWAGIVMRWPGGVIGQKSGRCRLNDPSQLMPHPDYISIHNTNMCMWALSHIYTCVICVTHRDIQTYRPKVCIWNQHNSHALVSTLSTIKKTTNANPSVHWSRNKSRWDYFESNVCRCGPQFQQAGGTTLVSPCFVRP